MLYQLEILDSVHFLDTCIQEIYEKADAIDAVTGCLNRLPITELLPRVDNLEAKTTRIET